MILIIIMINGKDSTVSRVKEKSSSHRTELEGPGDKPATFA